MQTPVVAGAVDALRALSDAHRQTMRAEARREAAKRELDQARQALQEVRTELWGSVREARAQGATYPQIAAVLGVSVQRAKQITQKPEAAARR